MYCFTTFRLTNFEELAHQYWSVLLNSGGSDCLKMISTVSFFHSIPRRKGRGLFTSLDKKKKPPGKE
jgi:hypothetical protein